MKTVFDVNPNKLIEMAAAALKKEGKLAPPEWSKFVKTGVSKQRPPANEDWWYVRAASILRTIYCAKRPIGVSKLRVKYGGRKDRGVRPAHFRRASGSIIRKIMQQLQKADYIAIEMKSMTKGRLISAKGKKFLDTISKEVSK